MKMSNINTRGDSNLTVQTLYEYNRMNFTDTAKLLLLF